MRNELLQQVCVCMCLTFMCTAFPCMGMYIASDYMLTHNDTPFCMYLGKKSQIQTDKERIITISIGKFNFMR